MSAAIFDPSWYRVAALKPRIRAHAQFHRHAYRGELWYVLQDHASERFHRFAPSAYALIGLMDGERSVQAIWEQAIATLGDDAPTQGETIQILSHLHTADVLQCDEVTPDTVELLERHERRVSQNRWQRIKSPLSIRLPLLDPDRLLRALDAPARLVFGPVGACVWLLVIAAGAVLAASHWPELSQNVTERALAPSNLPLLWLTFIVVKALHEFGHGFATRVWGGEVHEMGVMFLVLMPVPYVDASAASAFRERYRRVVVGAAGMLVEVFVAALAMMVWMLVEPGLVRTTAYNVMLIAGVSTVLFNGNPLLRFDGYYILSDLLDSPNLAARANRYLAYLVQRYAFGVREAEPPTYASGERFWFVVFGVASFIYRMTVYAFIILFVAGKFFFIGVMLALWAGYTMIVQPVFKGLRFVLTAPLLARHRERAVALSLAVIGGVAACIAFVPLPYFTRAEGVVWVPEQSIVRLETAGFVERVVATPGTTVQRGDVLVRLHDPDLQAEMTVLEFQLAEALARRRALQVDDAVQAAITGEEIAGLEARLVRLRARIAALDVVAPVAGRFVLPRDEDLPGRFLRQGEQIAYVMTPEETIARVVVPQDRVDLVRQGARAVDVRFANRPTLDIVAHIAREVPAATTELPSLALGSGGGGAVVIDPRHANAPRSLESLFQFDIVLDRPMPDYLGARLYVRFDHGTQTLGARWYRELRQLLLARFDV